MYQHSAKKGHRGGVALLVKPSVSKFIRNIDRSYENVISFELTILPNIIFVGCYITPSDSPYYDNAVFGHLQSLLKNDESKKFMIMGDLNSRVGVPTELRIRDKKLLYEGCNDVTVNKNGRCVLKLCEDNKLAVVNNLKLDNHHFESKLSFRKKLEWISEPDLLLASTNCLYLICSFNMIQYYGGRHLSSDHGLLETEINLEKIDISLDLLLERANYLGRSIHENIPIKIEKSLRLSQCNVDDIKVFFEQNIPPVIQETDSIDKVVNTFNCIVNEALKNNKVVRQVESSAWGNEERWKRLLQKNDQRKIWKAINWNGTIDENVLKTPTDEDFRMHFENLLNPEYAVEEGNIIDTSDLPFIPVLDDYITEIEVIEAAETCSETKSFIGITPAIFKCLPLVWISFVTQILNLVFCDNQFSYPAMWCYNKLVVLFKKGARWICGNYRGLSIGDTIGKLYAKILGNRLKMWMDVDKCQAGGQEERSCCEHILALRLIIDYAKKEKEKLFVLFVDFSKAYDKVPRKKLFEILRRLGCGGRFLRALIAIYKNTINILNSEYIKATIGVKQGGPMSCLLFIIYLNILALMLKSCGSDNFLKDIHALMLMDDTVLLASSREKIIEKFKILMKFCKEYGMIVNEVKTNIMVINGVRDDRENFCYENVTVKHTSSYIYLGSPFTGNGSVKSVLDLHVKIRTADLNKFKIFCKKNETMPFIFKKKVFDACISSSLLYGCETWLSDSLKEVEKLYIGAIKSLLGVRETSRNDTIFIESGIPPLKEMIQKRSAVFYKKQFLGMDVNVNDEKPLIKVYDLCKQKRTNGSEYIKKLLNGPNNFGMQSLRQKFNDDLGTKAMTYKMINNSLNVHKVYRSDTYINECERVAFTRLRLSSHNLYIEKGRWSRVPRENRLCECRQAVQDEEHILLDCPQTEHIRDNFQVDRETYENIGNLMDNLEVTQLIRFVKRCMDIFT